jgi:chromosome segregation ATPase
MQRSTAIAKLSKLLGKSLGYRVDPTAPSAWVRDQARAELAQARPQREALAKALEARSREILGADADYQRLKAEVAEAQRHCDALAAVTSHYRFTVGISNSLFFTVKAQGDSWEQVIEKLTPKA